MTCLYLLKIRQKNNILADAGHFLRTDNHSKDIKKENLTTKIRRNNGEKQCFVKKKNPKDPETDETIKQNKKISASKNIGQRNNSK